ncbi:MAG: nitrilase [Gammaproteobacteria bacterium AqS3]|nr:nitrilase [Gammaproteobacteria bacterium AqS3]
MSQQASHYYALALQIRCHTVNRLTVGDARARILDNIERIKRSIAASRAFIGPDCSFVVTGEYSLTGFPAGESVPEWREKACLEMDGPEYERLSKVAQSQGIYLAGNAYEIDPHFPELYFQTCYLIAPSGDVVLRYRRLISMYTPSPHDVLDKYLDIYGADGLFPVARTDIGRIAGTASEEILYPEIVRAFALRGAEVIFNSTSEAASPDTVKQCARRVRAVENLIYVIGANSGGYGDSAIPQNSVDGNSDIVDYRGQVLAQAGYGESMVAYAEVDLDALRRFRRRPGLPNTLSRLRLDLFQDQYRQTVYPANSWLRDGEVKVGSARDFYNTQQRVMEALAERGVI